MVDEGRRKARPTRVSRNGTIVLAATARRAAGIERVTAWCPYRSGPERCSSSASKGGERSQLARVPRLGRQPASRGVRRRRSGHTSTSCADRGASNAPGAPFAPRGRSSATPRRSCTGWSEPSPAILAAVDPVFDAVEAGDLACIVPAVCAAGCSRAPTRSAARRLGGGWAPPAPRLRRWRTRARYRALGSEARRQAHDASARGRARRSHRGRAPAPARHR